MTSLALVALMLLIAVGAIRQIRADPHWTRREILRQVGWFTLHMAAIVAVSFIVMRVFAPNGASPVRAMALTGGLLLYIAVSTIWLARKLRPPRSR